MKRALQCGLVGLGLVAGGASHAASRLVVHLAQPVVVLLDDSTQTASGTRVTVNHIAPGPHTVAFESSAGEPLGRVEINVPPDAVVQVRWAPGQPVSVQGSAPEPVASNDGGTPEAARSAAGPAPAVPPPRASAPPEPGDTSSFDANEGVPGRQRSPSEGGTGNPEALSRLTGAAARAGVGAARRTVPGGSLGMAAAGGVARGAANLVRNAEAGGLDALRRGGGRDTQGRPIPPKAKTGNVELVNDQGYPSAVYVDGFEVARFEAGTTRQVVLLEEGRHVLTFADLTTLEPRYAGLVRITEGARVVVEFGADAPPTATAQGWAWEPRQP